MLAEIYSGALTGIEAYAVSIEVNAGHGEPRTVADLAEAEWIGSVHVAEAVGYRLLDRPFS